MIDLQLKSNLVTIDDHFQGFTRVILTWSLQLTTATSSDNSPMYSVQSMQTLALVIATMTVPHTQHLTGVGSVAETVATTVAKTIAVRAVFVLICWYK